MARPNGYLLDTNVVVALVRDNPLGKHLDRTYGLTTGAAAFFVAVVTDGELRSLALKWGWGAVKGARLKLIIARFIRLDISGESTLDFYAEADDISTNDGRTMGKNDLWIAALARAYDLTLLTTDGDFDHLHMAGLADIERISPAAGGP